MIISARVSFLADISRKVICSKTAPAIAYKADLRVKKSTSLSVTKSSSSTKRDTGYRQINFAFSGNPSIVVHSTAATFGNPTYIDCDIGEAYAIDNGITSSLDRYIQIGAELPTLKSGSNTITYDNTVTTFKITPRWWKV